MHMFWIHEDSLYLPIEKSYKSVARNLNHVLIDMPYHDAQSRYSHGGLKESSGFDRAFSALFFADFKHRRGRPGRWERRRSDT